MDPEERKRLIEERAHALWEEAGKPQGGDLMYWLIAEQELDTKSVAGEEDPGVGLDDLEPGGLIDQK